MGNTHRVSMDNGDRACFHDADDDKLRTWSNISSNFGKTLGIFRTIIESADIPDGKGDNLDEDDDNVDDDEYDDDACFC